MRKLHMMEALLTSQAEPTGKYSAMWLRTTAQTIQAIKIRAALFRKLSMVRCGTRSQDLIADNVGRRLPDPVQPDN